MPLPKVYISYTGVKRNPDNGNGFYIITNIACIPPTGDIGGGEMDIYYTGNENDVQINKFITDAGIAIAAGMGYTVTANDIIMPRLTKGQA